MQQKREVLIEQTLSVSPSNSAPQKDVTIPREGFFFIPLCFLLLLSVAFLKQSKFKQALYNRIMTLKLYYQIPCFRCQFFKRNQYIQCAVQPYFVLNKEAVNCPDYSPCKGNNGG
jgi:hypothetical protein